MATTALLGTGDAELLGGLASGQLTAALAVGVRHHAARPR